MQNTNLICKSAQPAGYKKSEKKKLKLAMAVTGVVMIIEVIGGILTNSLALVSDAGHMLTHLFALAVSLIAIVIASQEPCHHRTFGLYRAETLAALFNGLFLFAITALIVYESTRRILAPKEVHASQMLLVAAIGLAANLTSALLLSGSHKEDLNIRSAFLHVLADTFSSVAIIVGGAVIYFTNWNVIDPILSIVIALLILRWSIKLLIDSVNILLESAPKGLNIEMIAKALLKEIPEIRGISDMHIWVITSNMYSFTAHIEIDRGDQTRQKEIIEKVNATLKEKYKIEHTTIQIEIAHRS